MSIVRNAIHHAASLARAAMVVTATLSAGANAAGPADRATAVASAACQAARQQAFFERELRRTDGDNQPLDAFDPRSCASAASTPETFAKALVPVRAVAAGSKHAASAPPASAECALARQQAWFERQLRATEGPGEPLEPADPASCASMHPSR